MFKNPITKDGFENLKTRLNFLKTTERIKIINDIKTARQHGDLKENAEYHAAKEAQFLLEKKIKELEDKILTAQIIELTKEEKHDKISFGSTVHLINLENKQHCTYKIVGEDESNIKNNKLSIKSPLAKSLLQKSEGETIKLHLPSGTVQYKIIKLE